MYKQDVLIAAVQILLIGSSASLAITKLNY